MSPVNEADSRGLPKMLIGDVPPRTDTNLVTKEGRIYFGERTDNYIIVDTATREFDFPLGERNATYEYKGKAGVSGRLDHQAPRVGDHDERRRPDPVLAVGPAREPHGVPPQHPRTRRRPSPRS